MTNDGTKSYDHQHDGSGQIQGSCIRDFRNKPFPVRLKIEYIKQGLSVRRKTLPVAITGELFVFRRSIWTTASRKMTMPLNSVPVWTVFNCPRQVISVSLLRRAVLPTITMCWNFSRLPFRINKSRLRIKRRPMNKRRNTKTNTRNTKQIWRNNKQSAFTYFAGSLHTSFIHLDIRRIILIRRHRSANKHWWVVPFGRGDLQCVAVF